jgi:hypothetical protein
MLVRNRHRNALRTVFLALGATLGALEIVERFDDRLAGEEEME